MRDDPFSMLGLSQEAELTDDDVRAAWRRVAAATHPDRSDGGDPAHFAEAAAAYSELRTGFGRGESLAAMRQAVAAPEVPEGRRWPFGLLLRVAIALAAGGCGLLAAGPGPAGPALAAGALTWLAVTARHRRT